MKYLLKIKDKYFNNFIRINSHSIDFKWTTVKSKALPLTKNDVDLILSTMPNLTECSLFTILPPERLSEAIMRQVKEEKLTEVSK